MKGFDDKLLNNWIHSNNAMLDLQINKFIRKALEWNF